MFYLSCLRWWHQNEAITEDLLTCHVFTIAVGATFSTLGQILHEIQFNMSNKFIKAQLCIKKKLKEVRDSN